LNSARIDLTGGTGFLGRSLGAFLAARGYQVVLISHNVLRSGSTPLIMRPN
jgi:uncharacterized protein YbjT (DUF2867 family)